VSSPPTRLAALALGGAALLLGALVLDPATSTAADAVSSPAVARAARLDLAYRVALADPAAHLYRITLDVRNVTDRMLALQMPVWSPGRYARMEFAKNVSAFRATTPDGRAVRWDKEHGARWRVYPGGARALRIEYSVFANDLSGTFSVLDSLHANWNGASLFMYVDGHKADPVRLTIDAPAEWLVMNGESDRLRQREFRFPTYDHLIDTPTEVAPGFLVDSFATDGITYRVMTHYNGAAPTASRERFVRDLERIVRAQNRVISPPPIPRYTFLFHIGFPGGDGMEHLTSTQIINAAPWIDTATVLSGISTGSHEYFHTWNVKRIRPVALGPFDYTREQYQPSLWVAEGWTNYYGNITLHRAGIVPKEHYYRNLARIISVNSESPGRREVSARMASFQAPYFDGAAHAMRHNGVNTWVSYYLMGEGRAALLDLEIRAATNGRRSLDHALRDLKRRTWDAPTASYYLRGRGYTERDVELAASAAAGRDLTAWFARYVGGTEELPWSETLAKVGLRVVVDAQRRYSLEEIPGATVEQVALRAGWLAGTTRD